MVEEVGEGKSTGGRRPTLLRLRTSGAIAIGVNITPTYTTIASSDLAGAVVQQESFRTDPIPERTVNRIIEIIRKFSELSSIEESALAFPD